MTRIPIRLPGKANKYKAKRHDQHGFVHGSASRREATRLAELQLLEKAREITGLKTQVPFDLVVIGVKICRYVADFTYRTKKLMRDLELGELVVEDSKGCKTQVYRIKKLLMKAVYNIDIKET